MKGKCNTIQNKNHDCLAENNEAKIKVTQTAPRKQPNHLEGALLVNWHETRAVGALSASSLQFKTSGLLLFKSVDASAKGATLPNKTSRI